MAARAKKAATVVEDEAPVKRARGRRRPDETRYQKFAAWLKREKGLDHPYEILRDAITNYQEYQRSDENKEYNAAKRAARAKASDVEDDYEDEEETPKPRRRRKAAVVEEEPEEETPAPKRRRARKTAAAE